MSEAKVYCFTTILGRAPAAARRSLKTAMEWKPDVLVSQGTSTSIGPHYLGSGVTMNDEGLRLDLDVLLTTAKDAGIPFIGSVTRAGTDAQLEKGLEIIDDIAKKNHAHFRIAVISGELSKDFLKKILAEGIKVRRIPNSPNLSEFLTPNDIDQSARIVAQLGPEPVMQALDRDVDAVITGRSLDIGLFAAFPIKKGFDKGLSMHMGKILECGGLAAYPPNGGDGLFGIMKKDHFLVKSPDPERKCTVLSVAEHSFYERDNPFKEDNPGGYLDVGSAEYDQYDEKTIKVTSSKWVPAAEYTVKIEGAKRAGYRTIVIAGIRDPRLIVHIDQVLTDVRNVVETNFSYLAPGDYNLKFRIYGKNGVMGEREPQKNITSHELCVIIDVVAKTQEVANSICFTARGTLLHREFPGRISTAGNIAFPFSPLEIPMGETYAWNIWHALPLDDPVQPFQIKVMDFPR